MVRQQVEQQSDTVGKGWQSMQRQRRPPKVPDYVMLYSGAALCGVLIALGLYLLPDWPRRITCFVAALAGLGFFAWVIRRYFI